MTLVEVLALRPGEGADAATIAAAIDTAEDMRRKFLDEAKTADTGREGGLLTLDDKAIAGLEREGGQARRAADRIGALLPDIRADLAKARGSETLAELRTQHETVMKCVAAAEAWHETEWPKVRELIFSGLLCERTAKGAVNEFAAALQEAYRRTEVEDAGPLGLPMPKIPQSTASGLMLTLALTGRA